MLIIHYLLTNFNSKSTISLDCSKFLRFAQTACVTYDEYVNNISFVCDEFQKNCAVHEDRKAYVTYLFLSLMYLTPVIDAITNARHMISTSVTVFLSASDFVPLSATPAPAPTSSVVGCSFVTVVP